MKNLLCAITLCAAIPLFGSEHRGVVTFGSVGVPGATVTATHNEKKFTAVTDEQGAYSFPDLPDGLWTIDVQMLCFAPLRQEVRVAPGTPAAEWTLTLLPLEEIRSAAMPAPAVEYAAAAAPDTNRTDAAAQRRGSAKAEPQAANTSRPFQQTDVNAAAASASARPPSAPATDAEAAADLSSQAADGFLINGSTNNGAAFPFALPAAFGNNRRGPKSLYNGNIGFTVDNSVWDARAFSLTGQDTPKPAYNHFTGLVSFGGPLRIPHLLKNGPMLAVNYEWTRNRNATVDTSLMPTADERAGDLSQSLSALGKPVRIFDPSTGEPFPNSRIPLSRISPQARALLDFYPLPNFQGGARYNYQAPLLGAMHQDSLQSRANKTVGRRDQLSGNFAWQSTRTDTPSLFQFLDVADAGGWNASATWRHTFAPRMFGTFTYRFSRLSTRVTPFFENRRNVSGDAGISGNLQDPLDWGPPNLHFSTGFAALGDAPQSFTRNQTNGMSFDMLWTRASHNISYGAEFRRQQFNLFSQQDARGTFTFTGSATGARANGVPVPGTGFDFAGFLLGVPDTSAIAFGNADKYLRASSYAAFINDDWRINPGLSVDAGVRWEYNSPITELYGRLVNLDIAPAFAAVAPVVASNPVGALTGRTYPDSLIHPDKHAIQPRAAVAWRPFPASSTIVRAGYGVYYNTSVYQTIASNMAQQYPLSKTIRVQNSEAHALTLANGFLASGSIVPNTFAVDPNFRVGYSQNWQASVQSDMPGGMVVTATYLGTKGTRGVQSFLPNTYPIGAVNPCPICPAGYTYLASNGNSTREAFQMQVRRRLHNGFTATAQYTFSKSIDDAALGGRGQGAAVIAQDWLNLRAERALSSFDQRHLLSVQAQYSTGMGVTGGTFVNGWRGAILKDWTIATQINAGSGFPLTPVYPAAVQGTGVTGPIRPDYTGAPLYDALPGLFLNPAAYSAPAPGKWGNAGRNSITGPAQFILNASAGRTFRSSERVSIDVRIDATNALNHVTYPSWNTMVSSAQFGLPNVANPMRSIQTTVRLRF